MTQALQDAGEIVLIYLNILIWPGPNRLKIKDAAAWDEIYAQDELQAFRRIANRMRHDCLAAGSRFMKGFAVPEIRIAELTAKLDELAAEFDAAQDAFLDRYDATIERLITDRPQVKAAFHRWGVSTEEATRGLCCNYSLVRSKDSANEHAMIAQAGISDLRLV